MPKYTDKEIRQFEQERLNNGKRYGFQFGRSDIEHIFDIYEKLQAIEPGYAKTVDPDKNKYNSHYIRQFMQSNDYLLDQSRYALQWYLAHGHFPKLSAELLYRECSDDPEYDSMMHRVGEIYNRIEKEEDIRFKMERERREDMQNKVFDLISWFKDRESDDPIPSQFESLVNNKTLAELLHYSRHSEWPGRVVMNQ